MKLGYSYCINIQWADVEIEIFIPSAGHFKRGGAWQSLRPPD